MCSIIYSACLELGDDYLSQYYDKIVYSYIIVLVIHVSYI